MVRSIGLLCALLAIGFVLSGATAQEKKKDLDVDAIFKKLDTNSDGKLSKDEFLKLVDRFKDRDKVREKLTMAYISIDPQNAGLSKDQFRRYLDSVKKNEKSAK